MATQDTVTYNNNILSYKGKIGRLSYFIQNSILMMLAFKYMYYPYIYSSILSLQHNPLFAMQFEILKSLPQFHDFLREAKAGANPGMEDILIKYLFFIPLRIVDLKRLRDIFNRNFTSIETAVIVFVLSLPFVDLLSTVFLVIIPANRFHKSDVAKKMVTEIKKADMQSAQVEKYLETNKRLFEAGRISRAEYEAAIKKYRK